MWLCCKIMGTKEVQQKSQHSPQCLSIGVIKEKTHTEWLYLNGVGGGKQVKMVEI